MPKPDLSNLTKDEKLRLLDSIKEQKRRKKLKSTRMVPNAGQMPVIKSGAMQRAMTSGNGAGKTCLGVHLVMWHAQGYNPITKEMNKVPTDAVVLIDQGRKADLIWKKEVQKWFEIPDKCFKKNGTPYTQEIHLENGSIIRFFSQEAAEYSFEGIQGYSLVLADEPCPEWQYNALFRGAREKGTIPKFVILGTLIGPNSVWLRKLKNQWETEGIEDWEFFTTSSWVNEDNLSDGFLHKFAARLSDAERHIRLEGGASDLDGLALAHLFNRRDHVVPVEEFRPDCNMPCVIGIDPHTRKNSVAVLLGVDNEGMLFAIDEVSVKKTAAEFYQDIKPWMDKYQIIDVVCDSSGSADMTSGDHFRSFISVLTECMQRHHRIGCRSTRYSEKSDEAFIDRIQDVLLLPEKEDIFGKRIPKLRILDACKGLISNVENATWQRDRRMGINKPKLDIRELDYLAALKYALACNLTPRASRYHPVRINWNGKRR